MTEKISHWSLLAGIFILFIAISNTAEAQGKTTVERSGDAIQILIPAAAYAATFYLDDQEGRAQFHKSFFLNLGVTYTLKYAVKKNRPSGNREDSFPSGHTSAAFQGAAFIQKRYGWRYGIPGYIGAAFVGWSRVEAEKHDDSDVIAGAAIGIVSSYLFTTPYKDVAVTPVAENGSYGLHVRMKW